VETAAAEGVIDCEKDGGGQELSFAGGEHTPIPLPYGDRGVKYQEYRALGDFETL
jgi:hypothetical protein